MSLLNKKLLFRNKIAGKKNFDFLHVPKTGGTYLSQYETDSKPVLQPIRSLSHAYLVDDGFDQEKDLPKRGVHPNGIRNIKEIENSFVFSTVRNIYEWLVSYAHHSGGWSSKYHDTSHYDYENANKGFEYLLKTIADRDDIWPSRGIIHLHMFAQPSGKCVVDWINYNHRLDADLKHMSRVFGLKYRPNLPKQRVSGYDSYLKFYDDKLLNFVYDTWKNEIDFFGFKPEGEKDTFLAGNYNHMKDKIHFSWREHQFVIKE